MTNIYNSRVFPSLSATLCVITLLLLNTTAAAQDGSDYVNDEGERTTGAVWTELGVTKILPYDLSISLDAGFRTDEWFKEACRADIGVGLNWKPFKHWRFGVGYTFLMKHYRIETEHKTEIEQEYKYRALSASENTDFYTFMGAPLYTDYDGTSYIYHGYNDATKQFTRVTDSYWRQRHRVSFDAAYSYKLLGILRLTLRERYQLTFIPAKKVGRTRDRVKTVTKYRDAYYGIDGEISGYDEIYYYYQDGSTIYRLDKTDDNTIAEDYTTSYLAEHDGEYLNTTEAFEKEKSSKTLHVLRSRLTFEIDKKGWKWTPYVSIELFNNMGDEFELDKVRTITGVEYAVSKLHKISAGYVFNHENDIDGDQNIHAISIGYRFKF